MANRAQRAIYYYDEEPETADFLTDVLNGLARRPRAIPPKYFYDQRGSQLFDQICETAEYYPTRTERYLLAKHAADISQLVKRHCLLIEPGSGSSDKVRLLLDSLKPAAYLPMDISRDFLFAAARDLSKDYPWLEVHATCIDFTDAIALPYCPDDCQRVVFFPGSSIGNFEPEAAIQFLANLAELAGAGGSLLIGVDLKKQSHILDAAYNDKQGITAAFNLNLLQRMQYELAAELDIRNFKHRAFYNAELGRIEMHLVSSCRQTITVDGHVFELDKHEHIHTENSYKYTVDEFIALANRAGFVSRRVWTDKDGLFSLHYLDVATG